MTTIGLCMIVQDEAPVIERCLTSVRDRIDHWLIVDTGSTDGTPDLIAKILGDIPGRLYQRPFVDFGYNRTEAVQAARVGADYTLLIDADEVLISADEFTWPVLESDIVELAHMAGNQTRRQPVLLSNRRSWHFAGPLFERLVTDAGDSRAFLPNLVVREFKDGNRHTAVTPIERNTLDARVLEAALKDLTPAAGAPEAEDGAPVAADPLALHLRYRLAGCYRDSNRAAKALEAYAQRAALGGDQGEVADSLLQIAHLLQRSGAEADRVVASYLNAWEAMPTRAEPLTDLAGYAREQGRYSLARMMAARALEIPPPADAPYIDETVYRWRSQDEYAVASYWTGNVLESAVASHDLIARGVLPDAELARVEQNLAFARARCEEAGLTVTPEAAAAAIAAARAAVTVPAAAAQSAQPSVQPSAQPPAPAVETTEDRRDQDAADVEEELDDVEAPVVAAGSPPPAGFLGRAGQATGQAAGQAAGQPTGQPAGPSGAEAEARIPVPMAALDDKAHQFRGLIPAPEPERARD
ncbi:hypothetical protein GCM10009547_32330 [Sporichthya brevicatena]|uniref:Glycosyltransferase 2-like domain-containing protein n=1 Tax=Sporichthya brevicatena TaxID=171442 RepID=A0ABN1H1L6_9ACTN